MLNRSCRAFYLCLTSHVSFFPSSFYLFIQEAVWSLPPLSAGWFRTTSVCLLCSQTMCQSPQLHPLLESCVHVCTLDFLSDFQATCSRPFVSLWARLQWNELPLKCSLNATTEERQKTGTTSSQRFIYNLKQFEAGGGTDIQLTDTWYPFPFPIASPLFPFTLLFSQVHF